MSVLHLVRHASHAELGGVLSGRSEIGLSARGRAQAEGLAHRLARHRLSAIHSSPRRARETAEAVAKAQGLDVEIVDALDELDFGRWMGLSFARLAGDPGWKRWNDDRATACPPGGESMAAAVERAVGHVEATAAAEKGAVLIVSHGDIIRGVIAHYLGLPLGRLLAFDVEPASISTLSVGSWGGRLISLNEGAHE